ncbi:hypothetical protein CHELA40_15052 [Chelatococcus asaccharovorans]|nr:hypothetical protein CHELA17_60568 [Chelatococcus asaccharovorans]CAH1681356.1 hypothetical protein CHELA40_15052 [Chelatococcus asaccharovorans]
MITASPAASVSHGTSVVIPGRAGRPEPGTYEHDGQSIKRWPDVSSCPLWCSWVPGSLLTQGPGMTA